MNKIAMTAAILMVVALLGLGTLATAPVMAANPDANIAPALTN